MQFSDDFRADFPEMVKEMELIEQIQAADSPWRRTQLINLLDQLPAPTFELHHRWSVINQIWPFHCWTDNGYDPSLSELPRDLQLLEATNYGFLDIFNGGFHQFFSNCTGTFAPEMVEWFQRSGLSESANVMLRAIEVFGSRFPRAQTDRQEFLSQFQGGEEHEWNPFRQLDELFYASLPHEEHVFELAVDRWLREVCGIRSLHDPVPVVPA